MDVHSYECACASRGPIDGQMPVPRLANPINRCLIPLCSPPNCREKVVFLADWDAPYRSAQECPFVYGMPLLVRIKRETESGEKSVVGRSRAERIRSQSNVEERLSGAG